MNDQINKSVRKEIPVKDGFLWLDEKKKIMFTHKQGYTMKMTYRDLHNKLFEALYE